MTPTIHVMTIPNTGREKYIDALRESTSGEVCVHEDPERKGILDNHLDSLRCAADRNERWSIFASDDIEAIRGWEDEMPSVMRFAPAPFVSLTHFAKYGQSLVRKGIPWGVGDHCIWGPAFMVHSDVLDLYWELVTDIAEMDYEKYRNWDDGLPTIFNLLYGSKSAMTARALFQHLDVESVMGHHLGHWRHAESTIKQPGPWWGNGKTGAPGLSVQQIHRELAREVAMFRRGRESRR